MKKFGLRHQCAFGALAISLAIAPATAQAQDATTADTDEADLIDNADVDTGPVIIVRAQGREQALTDVPVAVSAVRRQNIWHNSRRRIAECGPRLGLMFRRRACGVASADVRVSFA